MTTVAITGADGQVGTLLRRRLVEDMVDELPLGSGGEWPAAIARADVVAHLAGTLQPRGRNTYEAANVGTTETVARAAAAAGVSRVVFLSYVGASPEAHNAYLRTKGVAERLLVESGVPSTILRCLHIFGPPAHPGPTASAFLAPRRGSVRVPGDGTQRIEPLFIGDVVEAVRRALLDPEAPTGVFELGGPEEMSMDDFVNALNGGSARISHLPAGLARPLAHALPSLTPALMDLLLRDNVVSGELPFASDAFALHLTRVETVWPRARSRA